MKILFRLCIYLPIKVKDLYFSETRCEKNCKPVENVPKEHFYTHYNYGRPLRRWNTMQEGSSWT